MGVKSRQKKKTHASLLECNRFVVKEQVDFLRNYDVYEILNGDTGKPLGTAEERIGPVVRLLRWLIDKDYLPTRVEVRKRPDNSLAFTISRRGYLFNGTINVFDSEGKLVGTFRSKFLAAGFKIHDRDGKHVADFRAEAVGSDYRFVTVGAEVELAQVKRRRLGTLKDLYTTADTYEVEIGPNMGNLKKGTLLILAATLAIDMFEFEILPKH